MLILTLAVVPSFGQGNIPEFCRPTRIVPLIEFLINRPFGVVTMSECPPQPQCFVLMGRVICPQ